MLLLVACACSDGRHRHLFAKGGNVCVAFEKPDGQTKRTTAPAPKFLIHADTRGRYHTYNQGRFSDLFRWQRLPDARSISGKECCEHLHGTYSSRYCSGFAPDSLFTGRRRQARPTDTLTGAKVSNKFDPANFSGGIRTPNRTGTTRCRAGRARSGCSNGGSSWL